MALQQQPKPRTVFQKTKCEMLIEESEQFTAFALLSAKQLHWDAAFGFNEDAFETILEAISWCEDDPEHLEKAQSYLNEHHDITQTINCIYHDTEAKRRLHLGKTYLLDDDIESSLMETQTAMYHLDEALNRCADDTQKIRLLEQKGITYTIIDMLEELK